MDLTTLLGPGTTAVVTVEMQRGIIGDLADGPLAREAQRKELAGTAARLASAARAAGVRVVHATVSMRPAPSSARSRRTSPATASTG